MIKMFVLNKSCRRLIKTLFLTFSVLVMCYTNSVLADNSTINFTGRFNQSGCTVTTGSTVTINLGDWLSSDFEGVGTYTSRKLIPITLNCSAGANVVATIQGDANSSFDGTLNLLSSGSGSAAGGIGVQLINASNVPLKLNQEFSVQSNVSTGLYDFNWYARYIQTKSTISAGPANATATVVINYK